MSDARYPNDNLIVSSEWLAERLGQPGIRILEVTPPGSGYAFGHVPGAVYLDLADVFTGGASGVARAAASPEDAAAVLGRLGIVPCKQIVVCDEIGGMSAAQALWLLEYLGFPEVSLLEGGLERWMAEGRPETAEVPNVEPAHFSPAVRRDRLATADWIASRLAAPDFCLIDCRTAAEYAEGHIPGALNRPWDQTIALGAHRAFRDAAELRADFLRIGAARTKEVVTYCATGMRSSHTYLTLRLLGYPQVRNYTGSWAEWGARSDLPRA